MLVNGYFHAAPHPGNLLVSPKGDLILLDFGMVKAIPNDIRVAIIELIDAANKEDFEGFIGANKRLGTITYEAPKSLMIEFSQRMFEIFSNENLSSESMQKLAFEVLESTRNLPFKLPSDAVYILRVSAIIEGLGTTYIENFNGVKDILPILQDNIPKALGMKEGLIATLIDDISSMPRDLRSIKELISKANSGEMSIVINDMQFDYIKKEFKEYLTPFIKSFAIMLFALSLMLYDDGLKDIALILLIFAFARILYKN